MKSCCECFKITSFLFDDRDKNLLSENCGFEIDCSRCGFASKMEEALYVLLTSKRQSPWGGRSCANLFYNVWNVMGQGFLMII